MKLSIFVILFFLPLSVFCQTYTTRTQGGNYGNGGAYVAPVVTRTYTVKPSLYTPPSSAANQSYKTPTPVYSTNKPAGNSVSPQKFTASKNVIPKTVADFKEAGEAKFTAKEYRAAIEMYNAAFSVTPGDPLILFMIGKCKNALKEYKEAIAFCTKAISLEPAYQQAFTERGDAKLQLEDFSGAIADYDESIKLHPYAATYFTRGLAKNGLSDYAAAAEDFTTTINLCNEIQLEFDKEDEQAYKKLSARKRKAAKDKTPRFVETEAIYSSAYYNRGNARMRLKQLTGALDDLTTAVTFDNKSYAAYFTRAMVYYLMENKSAACADLKAAMDLGYEGAKNIAQEICK